jgi:exonuclease SbcC
VTTVPLKSLYISDFRKLSGHRTIQLDAPIVLVHGPNDAGKTSVLSALDLALTGEVRSMRRQNERYTAHLPFHGQDFASVRAEVADDFAADSESMPMTVGGSRIEGVPALRRSAAQFYTERCYLDQVSLAQLLDLYQAHEPKEESALTRFVNELLGLEQLDALRSGLIESTNITRLRKLSEPAATARQRLDDASSALTTRTAELESARQGLSVARGALAEVVVQLGLELSDGNDEAFVIRTAELLPPLNSERSEKISRARNSVLALGGRVSALRNRPSVQRLEEAQLVLAVATAERVRWESEHAQLLDRLHLEAQRKP